MSAAPALSIDGGDVCRRTTHISTVTLAGSRAYKIKRPVRLSFLDYSTPELRRAACEEEVRVNRRLCPTLYLGVAAVVEEDGVRRLAEAGDAREAVDWAVVMERLPEERMMDRLLQRAQVTPGDVAAVAARIAAFHRNVVVPQAAPQATHGKSCSIAHRAFDNFRELQRRAHLVDGAGALPLLVKETRDFVRRHQTLFGRRVAAGFVVDGHGDLRPENVCLLDPPVIFDAIEFSERLRTVDVCSEAAFMAVSLEHHGQERLARAFADAYFSAWPEAYDGELWRFYGLYRAMVRVKVAVLTAEAEPENSGALLSEGRAYLELACRKAELLAKS